MGLKRRPLLAKGDQHLAATLRAKPGGDAIALTIGNFATTRVDGPFTLSDLAYNTIMNATIQDEQMACFRNVAEHLERGGRFAIEVIMPPLRRLPPGKPCGPSS